MGTPIAASDLTWLLMDRPNNLMHVNGMLVFDELPDIDDAVDTIMDRLVSKYRVLSQVPVLQKGRWEWVDDRNFDIGRHVRRVLLPDSRPETLQRFVSERFSEPFDRSRPLWEKLLVSGPPKQGGGGALVCRWHHGLADGIRLTQLLLGMCDADGDAVPVKVGREDHGVLDRVLHLAEHSVKDTLDYTLHSGEVVGRTVATVASTLNPLQLPHHLETAASFARHPTRLIDALTAPTSVENHSANSWRELGRLLLHEKADAGAWSGQPGVDKSVAWVDGVDLALVKRAAKGYGSTVNDLLTASVSLALTDYLRGRGVKRVHDLAWMMPVSLRPIDGRLPDELGNHFCVVLYEMPLGISDPVELIAEVRHRSTRLKNSAEPAVAFGMQRLIAEAPATVAKRITDYFSGKTIGQLSNVPGPRAAMSFAGSAVRSMVGWVPTSGDQPIGVALISYNGGVSIGVSSDARMIPDPDRIAELIGEKVDTIVASAPAA